MFRIFIVKIHSLRICQVVLINEWNSFFSILNYTCVIHRSSTIWTVSLVKKLNVIIIILLNFPIVFYLFHSKNTRERGQLPADSEIFSVRNRLTIISNRVLSITCHDFFSHIWHRSNLRNKKIIPAWY